MFSYTQLMIHNKQNSYDLEAFRTDGNLEKTSLETGSLGYTVDVATDPCKRRLICLRAVSRRGKLYTLSQRLDDIARSKRNRRNMSEES